MAAEDKITIIKGRRKQEWGKGELRGTEEREGRGREGHGHKSATTVAAIKLRKLVTIEKTLRVYPFSRHYISEQSNSPR